MSGYTFVLFSEIQPVQSRPLSSKKKLEGGVAAQNTLKKGNYEISLMS